LAQVRALAERLAREQERLDVLLNNAGIGTTLPGGGKRQESEDGYELRFAVNYLAPFLLTRLLVPMLRQSAPARIVNVSSAGQAPINFRDVMLTRRYDGVQAYCQSKLALVIMRFDLAEELAGTGVTANCLHPVTYMPTKMVLAARRTGATIIGSHETVRIMEQEGVPLAQLLPVGGGERIRISPEVTVAVYPNRDRPSGGSVVHERAAGDVYGGGSHGASLI